jgi:hypothetical protein
MISVNNKRDFIVHDSLIIGRVDNYVCVSVKHSVWSFVWSIAGKTVGDSVGRTVLHYVGSFL